jgi:hypothetical protein
MSFKKGKSGNPHGRPKGKLNKTTEKILNLKSLINLETNEINAYLFEHIKKGQSWAFQIYYNKIYDPVKKIKIGSSSSRAQAITQALNDFDLLSHSEILDEIKILKNLAEKEEKEEKEHNVVESLSDELICQMHDFLKKKEETK